MTSWKFISPISRMICTKLCKLSVVCIFMPDIAPGWPNLHCTFLAFIFVMSHKRLSHFPLTLILDFKLCVPKVQRTYKDNFPSCLPIKNKICFVYWLTEKSMIFSKYYVLSFVRSHFLPNILKYYPFPYTMKFCKNNIWGLANTIKMFSLENPK